MKKVFVLILLFSVIISCKQPPKDHMRFSGKITGLTENDTVLKVRSRIYNKTIKIDNEGRFKDTLHIGKPNYYFFSANEKVRFSAFLKNGYTLSLKADAADFKNTLKYKGRGSATNNYLTKRAIEVTQFTTPENRQALYTLDSVAFYQKLNDFEKKITDLLESSKKVDTFIVKKEKDGLSRFIKSFKSNYKRQHTIVVRLAKGKPSPKFENYENYKGGTSSLDDFKGKYVYIDVWATWCKPCFVELPALNELEKEYSGKVEFVSISTDGPKQYEAWKKMIKEKEMTGIQLIVGEDRNFFREYDIRNIPRFIFIDPEGNIINANAPKPSQKEEIRKLFSEQGL